MRYTVTWTNETGAEEQVSAETLQELSAALKAAGYDGPSIRVTDDAGFTRGWVSGDNWRAA